MQILKAPDQDALTRHLEGRASQPDGRLSRIWDRALKAGASWLGPQESTHDAFITPSAILERQERHAQLWRHINPVLNTLSAQLERGGFLGLWADADGVILQQRGGGKFLKTAQRLELIEGANWSESARGTNAIGTALQEGEDIGVMGAAHLQQPNHELVCYAALVKDPQGKIVGVLDVTSRQECAHELAMAAVLAARHAIELELKLSAYHRALSGGLEALSHVLDRCPTPALLLERDGTCRALNARAKAWFKRAQFEGTRHWSWSELERLHAHPEREIELVDQRGQRSRWRPVIEWLGEPHAHAALIFLEPLQRANAIMEAPLVARSATFEGICGDDPALERAKTLTARLAKTTLPVLYLAETGTGKELFARALHASSPRASSPFIALNCGAFSETLLEAELFGYGPGAFTGAKPLGHEGRLASAHQGTLFLDEVAELSPSAQAMLLRFLERGVYYRVGESAERRADVRVVAATCQDMEALIAQGKLRSDLYYRLKGATIRLPALREREDLPQLVSALVTTLYKEQGWAWPQPKLSAALLTQLKRHSWPGNIRELKNVLGVALVMAEGSPILNVEHLPDDLRGSQAPAPTTAPRSALSWAEAEGKALRQALEHARGNMSEAARQMGVARSTLYRMLERHGLR